MGKPWTKEDDLLLERLIREKKSTKEIATKLGRTEIAIRDRVNIKGLSLMPKDRILKKK